ncbi:MAG TPA: HlyD family efflux transporter periplasmic adaptor subunit [Bacteroidales bacterium]|nr:HlyD family efflux transporter periplasmic adaptor subunit [Bacteroidales bacterium]
MPEINPEIRSAEMDEIMGRPPAGLVRWGITVFFGLVALLLAGSWFFMYPDFIQASIEITGDFPPAEVKAKSTGKIDTLLIENNQKVAKDQLLGLLENPADFDDIRQLRTMLDSIKTDTLQYDHIALWLVAMNRPTRLGELQAPFTNLIAALQALDDYERIGYFRNKMEAASKQLKDYKTLYNFTYDQRNTLEKDFELAKKDFDRYARLYEEKVIPEQELDKAESSYLSRKLSFESIRTNLANIRIQISQLEAAIMEMELQDQQQMSGLVSTYSEAIENLCAQIDIWENRYVLKSPVDGNCVFTKYWSSNQNLTIGETVFTILPDTIGQIVGTLVIPQSGAGKVKPGQVVNIRLDSYPYMEFGMIEGRVTGISAVPEEGVYYATVTFPKGMISSYGKELPFNQRLTGTAEIITNDLRLFHRIIQPLKHLLYERM